MPQHSLQEWHCKAVKTIRQCCCPGKTRGAQRTRDRFSTNLASPLLHQAGSLSVSADVICASEHERWKTNPVGASSLTPALICSCISARVVQNVEAPDSLRMRRTPSRIKEADRQTGRLSNRLSASDGHRSALLVQATGEYRLWYMYSSLVF